MILAALPSLDWQAASETFLGLSVIPIALLSEVLPRLAEFPLSDKTVTQTVVRSAVCHRL